jgi:hypothetical protein
MRFSVLALALTAPLSALAQTPEQKGLEIAMISDKAQSGFKSEKADMTMELINAHGDVTTRKLALATLEGVEDGDKARSEFVWPADVKGTKLLTWTHKKGDDDQWLYLPAVKRIKRIASSNKTGSFMGSEFSYEDFGGQEVEKYTYKFLDEVQEGGRDCWRIERYPVDKNSGYKRQIVWMDKEYKSPLRIDYYDRKDELLKTAMFSGYQKFGEIWRIGKIEMGNVQTKKRSVITWANRKLGAALDEAMFRSESLEG